MSEDYRMQNPKNRTEIDTNNIGELIWWSYHLGKDPETLLSIIKVVGNSTEKVRNYKKNINTDLHPIN